MSYTFTIANNKKNDSGRTRSYDHLFTILTLFHDQNLSFSFINLPKYFFNNTRLIGLVMFVTGSSAYEFCPELV